MAIAAISAAAAVMKKRREMERDNNHPVRPIPVMGTGKEIGDQKRAYREKGYKGTFVQFSPSRLSLAKLFSIFSQARWGHSL